MDKRRFSDCYRVASSGCWNWTGSTLTSGYGQSYMIDGRERSRKGLRSQEGAHRVSYKLFIGEIPEGESVLHKCNNKLCVNPDHLYAGTQKDNMADYSLVAYPRTRDKDGGFLPEKRAVMRG